MLAKKNIYSNKNGGIYVMRNEVENKIINEILGKCNLKEKIVIKLFKRLIFKVYNHARIDIVNKML